MLNLAKIFKVTVYLQSKCYFDKKTVYMKKYDVIIIVRIVLQMSAFLLP